MALTNDDLLVIQKPSDRQHYKISVAQFKTNARFVVPTVEDPPANPINGDLYWDTNEATLFLYFDDDVNPQWVPASPNTIADIDGGVY